MRNKNHNGEHRPNLFGYIFRIILIVFAAALLIAYLSVYINPAVFSIPGFFGMYYIPILFINLLLLLLALTQRSRSAWIPFIILLPSLLLSEYFVKLGRNEDVYQGNSFKVMTYNVGQFASSKKGFPRGECKDSIVLLVERQRPDIACFQEFSISDTANVSKLFPGYPYKYYHFFKIRDNYYFGNLTISRFPIVSNGVISFKGSTNLSIYSDIKGKNMTLRVYNNHLESYNISPTSIVKKMGDGYEKLSKEIAQVHGKMKGSNQKRAKQVDEVMDHIQDSGLPCLVCGDFNDTPISYTYHQLCKESKDAFMEAGEGFGATYSVLWPMLRIDYVLVPESFGVKTYTVTKTRLSDHYPIITLIYDNYGTRN